MLRPRAIGYGGSRHVWEVNLPHRVMANSGGTSKRVEKFEKKAKVVTNVKIRSVICCGTAVEVLWWNVWLQR